MWKTTKLKFLPPLPRKVAQSTIKIIFDRHAIFAPLSRHFHFIPQRRGVMFCVIDPNINAISSRTNLPDPLYPINILQKQDKIIQPSVRQNITPWLNKNSKTKCTIGLLESFWEGFSLMPNIYTLLLRCQTKIMSFVCSLALLFSEKTFALLYCPICLPQHHPTSAFCSTSHP